MSDSKTHKSLEFNEDLIHKFIIAFCEILEIDLSDEQKTCPGIVTMFKMHQLVALGTLFEAAMKHIAYDQPLHRAVNEQLKATLQEYIETQDPPDLADYCYVPGHSHTAS